MPNQPIHPKQASGEPKKAVFSLDLRVVNPTNAREHWAKRSDRTATERGAAGWATVEAARDLRPPYRITLTRIGKRLLDSDAVPASLKGVRDGIADGLGIKDGPNDPAVWVYAQEIGPYGVRVEVEEVRP